MSKARQSKRQRYRKPRADYQAGGRVKASTGRWYPGKRIVDKIKGDSDTKGGAGPDTVAPDQVDKDLKGQGMGESAEAGLWKKAYETVNVFDDKTPVRDRIKARREAIEKNAPEDMSYFNDPVGASSEQYKTDLATDSANFQGEKQNVANVTSVTPAAAGPSTGGGASSFSGGSGGGGEMGSQERDNPSAPGSNNPSRNTNDPERDSERGPPDDIDLPVERDPTTGNPMSGILDEEARKARADRIAKYDEKVTDAAEGKVPESAKIADISKEGGTELQYESAKDITGKDPITIADREDDESQVVDPMADEVVKTVDKVAKAKDVTIDPVTGKPKKATQIDLDELDIVDEDADVEVAKGELSDESTVDIDDVKVKGVDPIEAATVADEFRSTDPEANAALVKEVTGKISPEAKADVVKVAGLSERKITRYKKQLRNAGLSEDDIKEIGNDPEALEDRVLEFTEEERGVIEGLPEEALVSTQIEGLLEGIEEGQPPAWARPAVAAVNQMLAQRGLSASTVGRDNLMNAIIQSALPIAQSNAQAIQASVAQSKDIEAKEAMQNAAMKQETALFNAGNVFKMDMANFNAAQQAAISNAKYFQTVALTETNNRQQAAIQDAVITSQLNIAEADMQTKARINNANAFLNLDMANLKNEQQANIAEAQIENQRMLSNQAAINTALSLNTQEQNKVDMFMTNMQKEIEVANAAQVNNMAQFNVAQENAATAREADRELDRRKANAMMAQDIEKHNSLMEFRRDAWNAANAAAVEAADVAYHRKTNQINTATQNAINMQNAMNSFKMSSQGLAFMNQELRDQADFEFKSYETEEQRVASIIVGALGASKEAYQDTAWRDAFLGQVENLIELV